MSDLTDKVTGRAKQAVGDITGSESTKRDGKQEEAKGEAKEDAARAQQQADEKAAKASDLENKT